MVAKRMARLGMILMIVEQITKAEWHELAVTEGLGTRTKSPDASIRYAPSF